MILRIEYLENLLYKQYIIDHPESGESSGKYPSNIGKLNHIKCVARYNGVHFFDILTAKSDPKMTHFVYFPFEMYFAPQRRVIFHLASDQLFPYPSL
jgi:hypothetical protein